MTDTFLMINGNMANEAILRASQLGGIQKHRNGAMILCQGQLYEAVGNYEIIKSDYLQAVQNQLNVDNPKTVRKKKVSKKDTE